MYPQIPRPDSDLYPIRSHDFFSLPLGHHECEVLPGGTNEAEESSSAWRNCSKNPGHPSFIPAPQFSIDDLPVWYREKWVLERVKDVAAMTVRLRVGYVSTARPDGYCFSQFRGICVPHFGTGTVRNVFRLMTGQCPCPQCKNSPSPNRTWYEIMVHTAHHVVYNSEEARATKVDLFYDDENADKDGRMKTIWGVQAVAAEGSTDFCVLTCATHDKTIIQQLNLTEDLTECDISAYHRNTVVMRKWCWAYEQFCVIVSHPHGQPKKVTIGEKKSRAADPKVRQRSSFVYTTDTCPGSSGAFIFITDRGLWGRVPKDITWGTLHSTGGAEERLNKSGLVEVMIRWPGGTNEAEVREFHPKTPGIPLHHSTEVLYH